MPRALSLYAWLAMGVAACVPGDPAGPHAPRAPQSQRIGALEACYGFEFPAGTKVVFSSHLDDRNRKLRAKLKLPTPEVPGFLGQFGYTPAELRRGPGRIGSDIDGWNPNTTDGLRHDSRSVQGKGHQTFALVEHGAITLVFMLQFGD